MREPDEQQHDPTMSESYWQQDHAIGEGQMDGKAFAIRLRLHFAEEAYQERRELVPLRQERSRRVYVHGRAYILVPAVRRSLGIYDRPSPSGAVGKILDSQWEGMRHQDIGNAQGWGYPAERLIVLWEGYLFDPYRQVDPRADPSLATLWTGFERLFLDRFPEAERMVTPSWEPVYPEVADWEGFLTARGYRRIDQQVFGKAV